MPSHLRVATHLSHERSEAEATAFLARFKGRTNGRAPLFTSDKLAAYLGALINNYSIPHYYERNRSGPQPKRPGRLLDKELLYAQIDKQREHGRVVDVQRRILIGKAKPILRILQGQQINTAYVERDNLTSRQSNGRLVRKTLSHSKKDYYLQRHLDLEDGVFNFVRPHLSLKVAVTSSNRKRKWQERTPAMVAGITDHVWTLEEFLSYRIPMIEE